ncbi:transposase [Roseomonas ludipueritiae]|uniref:Transposase n=1 Tax=Pseudoroseomonas ludipueritiae TaxID=198093 RepID=A0ABR7R9R1_9PROT|nr:transposase [Pseudoroseomonas ludipueritiae]
MPRSSPTAEAIRYAMNHRKGLEQFLTDGRIETDTNIVERAIRPICLSPMNTFSPAVTMVVQDGRLLPLWWKPASSTASTAALLYRRADPARQRLAQQPHRRTHAVVLGQS